MIIALFFRFYSDVPGWLAGVSQDSWLNSSRTGRNCLGAGIVSEAGRQGVGQEKLERANSARELQQSLHKRGGLCNACGFVLRNLGRAKHIQMCQTGQKPIQALTYIHKYTHTLTLTHSRRNEKRKKTYRSYSDCRVMLSHKHERHAVVSANLVTLIHEQQADSADSGSSSPSFII